MTAHPAERGVSVNGEPCRVWEKGEGEALGFLAGLGGLPRWPDFLEHLAAERRVVAPSLPGFPGATGHKKLDTHIDWVAATLDLLEGAGLEAGALEGADLVGHGPGALLAAEAAAMAPGLVRRLVLMAPFGLFDPEEPSADVFAQRASDLPALLSAHPEAYAEAQACPEGEDEVEWRVVQARASEAAARLLWPLGDPGLARRLHRIRVPVLVLLGSADRVIPASDAKRIAAGVSGPVETRSIEGAGHRLDFDAPDRCAEAVLRFLS